MRLCYALFFRYYARGDAVATRLPLLICHAHTLLYARLRALLRHIAAAAAFTQTAMPCYAACFTSRRCLRHDIFTAGA